MSPLVAAAFMLTAAAQDAPVGSDVPAPTAPPDTPAEPSPARLCADAAAGSEVEVCLQVAAVHPDEVDWIAAALRAHVDRRSADDRELLQALLLLLTTESGVEGARQLGQLADPRAVVPLAHAAAQRDLDVALEATAMLANYREGLEPLARFLADEKLRMDVRVAAAKALGELGGVDAADVLFAMLRRRNVAPQLRHAIVETVRDKFPEYRDQLEEHVTSDGSVWLAAASGLGLGYALFATGTLGQTDLSALGGGAGVLAGTTAGFLAGRAWPIEAADAAFLTATGATATAGGILIGAGMNRDDQSVAIAGGLIGELAGYSAGAALMGAHRGTAEDSVEATLIAGASGITAASLAGFVGDERPEIAAGVALVGGLGVGHVVAPLVDMDRHDRALVVLSSGYGLALGSLVPIGDARRRGLPVAGATLGALGGYALSEMFDPKSDVLLGASAGLAYGGAFSYGLGVLVDPDPPSPIPPTAALIGGTTGMIVGSTVAWKDPNRMELSDGVAVTIATGWAIWQTAGFCRVAEVDGRLTGLYLVIPAATGIASSIASPVLDIPIPSVLAATSLGAWGGYLAHVSAKLADQPTLPFALAGSDLGMLAGALTMSPAVNTPPLVIGLADAGGVLGLAVAALTANVATEDPDAIRIASLVGAGTGFTGGAILGASLQGKTRDIAWIPPRRVDRIGTWAIAPAVFVGSESVGYGARLEVTRW